MHSFSSLMHTAMVIGGFLSIIGLLMILWLWGFFSWENRDRKKAVRWEVELYTGPDFYKTDYAPVLIREVIATTARAAEFQIETDFRERYPDGFAVATYKGK